MPEQPTAATSSTCGHHDEAYLVIHLQVTVLGEAMVVVERPEFLEPVRLAQRSVVPQGKLLEVPAWIHPR